MRSTPSPCFACSSPVDGPLALPGRASTRRWVATVETRPSPTAATPPTTRPFWHPPADAALSTVSARTDKGGLAVDSRRALFIAQDGTNEGT